MEDINKDLTIKALMESNELLGGMLTRYRRITSYLRAENSRLRKLKNIQAQNDEEFRALCQDDFYIVDVPEGDGGLPEPEASQTCHCKDEQDVGGCCN